MALARGMWTPLGGRRGVRAYNSASNEGMSSRIVEGMTKLLPRSEARAEPPREDLRSSEDLVEVLRRDFEDREFLWTGRLSLDAFEASCVFADPTLEFVGPDKFKKNAQSLEFVSKNLIAGRRVDLLSIEDHTEFHSVVARRASPFYLCVSGALPLSSEPVGAGGGWWGTSLWRFLGGRG